MITRYITGFILSLALTLGVFGLVSYHLSTGHAVPSHELVYPLLAALAVIQLGVQVFFFLHLGDEKGPRWQSMSFALALVIVTIVVGGTLWIMANLQHGHDTTPYKDIVSPQTEG